LPRDDNRALAMRFTLLFVAYIVAGNILFAIPWIELHLVDPWTRLNASASAALATMLGARTSAEGTLVHSGSATLNIEQGCNGLHALLILLGAILAFPAKPGRRVAGVVMGTIAILGFNLIRLLNLILVARYFPARLELFHVYIWQTLIVVIAFLLFLVWGSMQARSLGGLNGNAPDHA
jgi:exosortase H (IPTLxxWG-CTERM-specific)